MKPLRTSIFAIVFATLCCCWLVGQSQTASDNSVTAESGAQAVAAPAPAMRDLDENTAGAGTQARKDQERYGTARRQTLRPGPLAPPLWEQAGQQQAVADLDAAAAERADMQPGATLGVNALPAEANPAQARGASPASENSAASEKSVAPVYSGLATRNPTAATIKGSGGARTPAPEQRSRP